MMTKKMLRVSVGLVMCLTLSSWVWNEKNENSAEIAQIAEDLRDIRDKQIANARKYAKVCSPLGVQVTIPPRIVIEDDLPSVRKALISILNSEINICKATIERNNVFFQSGEMSDEEYIYCENVFKECLQETFPNLINITEKGNLEAIKGVIDLLKKLWM